MNVKYLQQRQFLKGWSTTFNQKDSKISEQLEANFPACAEYIMYLSVPTCLLGNNVATVHRVFFVFFGVNLELISYICRYATNQIDSPVKVKLCLTIIDKYYFFGLYMLKGEVLLLTAHLSAIFAEIYCFLETSIYWKRNQVELTNYNLLLWDLPVKL